MNLGSFVSTKSLLIFAISINNKHFIMKKSLKKLSFAILFLVTMVNLQAQSNMEYNVYAGVSATGIFTSGNAFTASINPILAKKDNLKLESRFGYSSIKVTDTFMTGETGNAQVTIVQIGPRYVFRSVDKKFRPAISLLFGKSNLLNAKGNAFDNDGSGISMSFNIEAEIGRIILGLGLDGASNEIPSTVGLKAGFRF